MSRNSWDSLRDKPLEYYLVGATNAGTTMLRLAHEYASTAYLPPIIFIEHRAESHRILILSDAALVGELVGKIVLKALTKNGKITLTTRAGMAKRVHRHRESHRMRRALKANKTLLRLLHNDRQKLAKLTNGDATIKVSNPAMLAKSRSISSAQTLKTFPSCRLIS